PSLSCSINESSPLSVTNFKCDTVNLTSFLSNSGIVDTYSLPTKYSHSCTWRGVPGFPFSSYSMTQSRLFGKTTIGKMTDTRHLLLLAGPECAQSHPAFNSLSNISCAEA